MTQPRLDLVLINPGGREVVYQGLGATLTAIEPPLWCRLIAGYARDRACSVQIIDSEALGLSPARLADQVAALHPRLVTMVVFGHQPSASTQSMLGAAEACGAIHAAAPTLPILIVGGHVSALPEQTLRELSVDFACKGEGPVTVVQLVELLRAQNGEGIARSDLASVAGLVWRDGEAIVVNRSADLIADLDSDLHGDVWDMLPMSNYRAHNWQCFGDLDARTPYASIYTSLGCPYKCSFCCINAPFDTNRYRMRKPESVVAEVDKLYRIYGIKTFKIIDEMFVLNQRHVLQICNGLIALGYAHRLNFWAYARVDTVMPHMLDALRQAGIRWLALGIESSSKHVRDGARKNLRNEDIVQVVRDIQLAGIAVIGNFIFGLPDDTLDSMRETLDLAKELNCEFANFYSAMAYPGSQLFLEAVRRGIELPKTWSGYSQHSYDCQPLPTDVVPAKEVLRFRDAAFHEYFGRPAYLDMVTQRFGWETRDHVKEMARPRLRRALLEQA
jgi:anaerobic magnesium-protoporphyrin IX monomethyl ester cyclase